MSRRAAARGQTALTTRHQRPLQRAHLRCESQPGASARPLFAERTSTAGHRIARSRDAYFPAVANRSICRSWYLRCRAVDSVSGWMDAKCFASIS
jgi:hypothetical protein